MGSNKTLAGRGVRIVDLHLKPGYSQSDAAERQLARFRGELDSAIRAGAGEIVFIHGVGTGKLKNELRNILLSEYPSCGFQDAPFARFGVNGATLVVIKK
jgi:dsDNA-specific endonuclease/ATPase MutS2